MIAITFLLLASTGYSQTRCSKLTSDYKCPYGGEWITWLQAWSGFEPGNDPKYDPKIADPWYNFDKTWPKQMEKGLNITVTPPTCECKPTCEDGCSKDCKRETPKGAKGPKGCPYTKYDTAENNITDSSDNVKRPFRPGGFKFGILAIYNQPPVCVCVDNSYDRQVEIAIETLTPRARVCVLDATKADTNSNENPGEVADCDDGRFYKCFPAQTDHDMIFRIYCDSGCEDENVQLWYRVRMSPYRWTVKADAKGYAGSSNPTEMWCDYLPGEEPTREGANRMQYPLDIADVVPENYKYKTVNSGASSVGISSFLVAVVAFITTLLCL